MKPGDLEPVLGAAYLLMDRAYARLEGNRSRGLRVELSPKPAGPPQDLRALARLFLRELAAQKLRWAIARNNLPIREYIAEQAVLLAQGRSPASSSPPPQEDLSAEQRREIESLIAEVEAEIKAINERKSPADPRKIKASWEEKQQETKP